MNEVLVYQLTLMVVCMSLGAFVGASVICGIQSLADLLVARKVKHV